jgi:hypothetical protein
MSEFSAFWRAIYPNAEPTGWLMRAAGVRHWVRFHSLPLSKRYAETEDEFSILLGRQNELASAALGENHSCWMVQACWVTPDGCVEISDESEMFKETREFGLKHAFSFSEDEGNDDDASWNVMAAPVRWIQGGFDRVLLRIAGDRAAPTLWISTESGAVFAPYDGGVDLFLPSEVMVKELQSKHADWRSSHPCGL